MPSGGGDGLVARVCSLLARRTPPVGAADRARPPDCPLVQAARRRGLAGATVLRGFAGYGAHRRSHTTRLVDLSPDLPMVVEVVDGEAAVRAFLPIVQAMVREGLVTWERVNVIVYRHRDSRT